MKTLFNALSILSVVFLTGCAGKRQEDTNGFLYDMVISDYEKAYFELEGNPVVDYLTDETLVDELLFRKLAEGSPDYFTESDKDTLKLQLLEAKAEKIQSGTVLRS
ncbi:MAG: hypothetical protein DI539_02775 [Flavobacterium psychrophilum]|nr:MAG: hypothetical protein DI539_02775 [Flavobacterium psychrophilum]